MRISAGSVTRSRFVIALIWTPGPLPLIDTIRGLVHQNADNELHLLMSIISILFI